MQNHYLLALRFTTKLNFNSRFWLIIKIDSKELQLAGCVWAAPIGASAGAFGVLWGTLALTGQSPERPLIKRQEETLHPKTRLFLIISNADSAKC